MAQLARRLLLALAVLAMVVPVTPAAADELPPTDRLATPEIFGWLPYWSLDANIDYGAITTVAYFGIGAGADGYLRRYTGTGGLQTEYSRWLSPRVDQVIALAHANNVKVVLTIERMAWSANDVATTLALLNNPAARQSLAADIVAEIQQRGVDGVDLDFEPILKDTIDEFGLFLGELRAALDAVNPAYQLTFATTGSQRVAALDMYSSAFAAGNADALVIMGYPLRDLQAPRAGGLSPMYSPYSYDLKQIVNTYLNPTYAISPANIVLGLPWYGRDWPTKTDDLNAWTQDEESLYGRADNIFYRGVLQLAIANGRRFDPVEQSAWTAYRKRNCLDCPETWSEAYYEDADTLIYKYDWAVNVKGLRGVGIFALGYDNGQPEFWKGLRVVFRGLTDSDAPTGTFGIAPGEQFCDAPLVRLAFNLDDGATGSGAVYLRLSNSAATDASGQLSVGRIYPAAAEIPWPLDDPAVGGSNATGPRTVYAQWRDVTGNWSPVASTSFNVNSLAATAALDVAGGADLVANATIPVNVSQTGGGRTLGTVRISTSPVVTNGVLTYGVNGGPGTNIDLSLIDPATGGANADGRRSVYAQWRDSAGCWSDPVYERITLDRAAPIGTLSLVDSPPLSLDGAVQVLAPATDATSGVAELALSNDGVTWQSLAPGADPVAWSAGATPDGPWTISARWRDNAGNSSDVATTSLMLDRSGPVGTLVANDGASATNSSNVTLSAPASDISGVAEVLLSNAPDLLDGVLSGATSFAPDAVGDWALPGADTPDGTTQGAHTIYAQWRDGVGHWSEVASATIVVDRSAPAVTVPQIGLITNGQLALGGAVQVSGTWSASDQYSAVAGSAYQFVRQGDAWPLAPSATGLPPVQGAIDTASPWQLVATATDAAGNVSDPVASDPVTARVVQESDASVSYTGTWRSTTVATASGGAARYATARGATATFTFAGRGVAWVAPRGAKLGKAKVFIDGVLTATIDLRGPASARMLVFGRNWATSGAHTLRVKVLGTADRPRIDVDGFVILT